MFYTLAAGPAIDTVPRLDNAARHTLSWYTLILRANDDTHPPHQHAISIPKPGFWIRTESLLQPQWGCAWANQPDTAPHKPHPAWPGNP
jgi:hypothetical protein